MPASKNDVKIDFKRDFPGIPLAYPLAMESYKLARERFDLMEKRGQSLIVFITSIGLVLVTISSQRPAKPPASVSLVLAFLCYIVSVVFACGSQMWGKITSPDPRLLREKSLLWDEWTFQNNLIDWAGRHYTTNLAVITQRARMVTGTLIFGLISLVLLTLWTT
jgi:hypothetical protein